MKKFNDIDHLNLLINSKEFGVGSLVGLEESLADGLYERIKTIDLDIKKVHILALGLAEPFWDEVHERRKNGEKGSGIGIRIRLRGYSTEISYYRDSFYFKDKKSSFQKGTYIKKSSKYKYIERDISSLVNWEKELIREFEKPFSYYRESSQALVVARRKLRIAYNRAMNPQ